LKESPSVSALLPELQLQFWKEDELACTRESHLIQNPNPKSEIERGPSLEDQTPVNFWRLLVVACLTAPSAPLPVGEDLGGATGQSESQAKYQLTWADEFDQSGRPNPQNWTYENGFVRNEELQWYQPQNAWVRMAC
jgi:hypothetical protein